MALLNNYGSSVGTFDDVAEPYANYSIREAYGRLHPTFAQISLPNGVVVEDGFVTKSYTVNTTSSKPKDVYLVIVKCYPKDALDTGFDRFYLIDVTTGLPVVMNNRILKHIRDSVDNYYTFVNCGFKVSDDFRFIDVSSQHLSDASVVKVANSIFNVYEMWKEFPNEESMDSVRKLSKMREKMYEDVKNIDSLERNIKNFRSTLEEVKKSIKDEEDAINKKYEEIASSLDEFEARGYHIDINDVKKYFENRKNDIFDTHSIELNIITKDQEFEYQTSTGTHVYSNQNQSLTGEFVNSPVIKSTNDLDSYCSEYN